MAAMAVEWWGHHLRGSKRKFRFGAGPLIHSDGETATTILANKECADSQVPLILPVCAVVVESNVPMMMAHESLRKMKG